MAKRGRRGRPVDGVLVLDKPAGMTSNGALQEVKRLFNAQKAGHTGSLDPLATGVLPLCFGEATKFSQFLLEADKRYSTTMKLGVTTETGDADGEVVATATPPRLDAAQLEAIVANYRGLVTQVPSMYSAIKVNGEPLYKLARQGIEVERPSRDVMISHLTVERLEGDEIDLEIHCSKGTYVRTLVEDIGKDIGCGAHVTRLRRTASGPFVLAQAVTLEHLRTEAEAGDAACLDRHLLPVNRAVEDMPRVELTELTASYLEQGQPVQVANAPTDGMVQIFADDDETSRFIGVGEIIDDGRVAPRRLVVSVN